MRRDLREPVYMDRTDWFLILDEGELACAFMTGSRYGTMRSIRLDAQMWVLA